MHEVTLRREMKSQIEAFKNRPLIEGRDARPMTREEVDLYKDFVADAYADIEKLDQSPLDRNPAKGQVSLDKVTRDNGITDSGLRENTEQLEANFGGRSRVVEFMDDYSSRPVPPSGGSSHSSTDALWAEQNIGFIAGISLKRNEDTVSGVRFRIDRLHPENSMIVFDQPATAREI